MNQKIIFPRGFLFSTSTITKELSIPADFVQINSPFNLYIHPFTTFWHKSDDHTYVCIMGNVSSYQQIEANEEEIVSHLFAKLSISIDSFFTEILNLVGRFAIIFSKNGKTYCLNDATGMRTIYYDRENSSVIASHAKMFGKKVNKGSISNFKWGYPGNHTPFEGIRILTPNTYYCLMDGAVKRFFPSCTQSIKEEIMHEGNDWLKRASSIIHYKSNRYNLLSGLTAGIDSRFTLALSLPFKDNITFYTYIENKNHSSHIIDGHIGRSIASKLGLQHICFEVGSLEHPERELLINKIKKSLYYYHNLSVSIDYMSLQKEKKYLLMRSNTLEIGRCFYQKLKFDSSQLQNDWIKYYTQFPRMPKYTEEQLTEIKSSFNDFFETSKFHEFCNFIEPRDAFYWEHRMGAWHSQIPLSSDIALDTFVPFNNWKFFMWLLSIPYEERLSGKFFLDLIKQVAPDLSNIPINPTSLTTKTIHFIKYPVMTVSNESKNSTQLFDNNLYTDYLNKGDIYAAEENIKAATSFYKKAIENNSSNSIEVYDRLDDLLKKDNIEELIEVYREAIQHNPNIFLFYKRLADLFQKQGRLDEAISFYKKAITKNENFSWSYKHLGDALEKQGIYCLKEAIDNYQTAIQLKPKMADVLTKKIRTLSKKLESEHNNFIPTDRNNYWKDRKDDVLYKIVKSLAHGYVPEGGSILDVGCHTSSFIFELDWFAEKTVTDRPFLAKHWDTVEGVEFIPGDFYKLQFDKIFDLVLCTQVVEHLQKPKEFIQKLLSLGKTVIVSTTYEVPEGVCKYHVQDPINFEKFQSWFDTEFTATVIIQKPNSKIWKNIVGVVTKN